MQVGNDAETLADLERQHEVVDTQIRSTDGVDYNQVRSAARDLIHKRKGGMSSGKLQTFATTHYPYFCSKFPQFLKAIVRDCEVKRLDEFARVMHSLLDGLEKVQKGDLSQSELRKDIFETRLANRYLRRT
jgi:hypothetical protein